MLSLNFKRYWNILVRIASFCKRKTSFHYCDSKRVIILIIRQVISSTLSNTIMFQGYQQVINNNISQIIGNKAKGWISKRVFQENKWHQILRKTNARTCVYQGVRMFVFLENSAYFVFLKYAFWDLPFCLATNVVKLFRWIIFTIMFF